MTRRRCAALLVALLTLSACQTYDPPPPPPEPPSDSLDTRTRSIMALLRESGQHERFVVALDSSGLADELGYAGPYTVFAPTDEALRRARIRVDSLLQPAQRDSLRQVLGYHLLRGHFGPEGIADSLLVATLREEPIVLRPMASDSSRLQAQGVALQPRIEAANGWLYVASELITPPMPDTTGGALNTIPGDSALARSGTPATR